MKNTSTKPMLDIGQKEQLRKKGWELTSNDPIMRELELSAINQFLKTFSNKQTVIVDLGCGDGFIERNIKGISFKEWHGIDPTEALIKKTIPTKKIKYHHGDIHVLESLPSPDILFTVRALINVPDLKHTYSAIKKFCHKNTKILFCESSIQGLKKINSARAFFNLEPIKAPGFNNFIDEKLLTKYFKIISVEHFASSYYFGSRIVNALANPKKQNYHDPINLYFKNVPQFGEWAPQRIFVCQIK